MTQPLNRRLATEQYVATKAAGKVESTAFGEGGPYLLATFGGQNVGADELSLCVYPSVDGKNFLNSHTNPVVFSSPGMRDPSIIEINGTFYCAVTSASFSLSQYTTVVNVWTTTDPMSRAWSLLTTLDFSTQSGAVNPQVWAPKFFVDNDGSVYLYVSVNQASLWCVKATNSALTTWTAPFDVSPTPTVGQQIDPYVTRVGNVYHLFFKKNSDLSICHATGTSPTGPFTVTQTGLAWNGLNSLTAPTGAGFEGPVVVQIADSRWRMYVDVTHIGGLYYSETTDPTLASGWTTWLPCLIDGSYVSGNGRLRHGTVIRLRPAVRAAARWNNSVPRASTATLQRKQRFAGNISITSVGTWVILDTGLNLTFPQCRAGDWLEVGFGGVWAASANEGHLEFVTLVAGATTVRLFAGNSGAGGIGQPALFGPAGSAILPVSTTDWYQVNQADINTDGSVVVTLIGKTTSTGRNLLATSTNGITLWGRKHS